jgi:hypothetical protein
LSPISEKSCETQCVVDAAYRLSQNILKIYSGFVLFPKHLWSTPQNFKIRIEIFGIPDPENFFGGFEKEKT